jgi:hypothetical protein
MEIRGCFPQDKRPYFQLPLTWFDRLDLLQNQIQAIKVDTSFESQWDSLAPSSFGTYASYACLVRFSSYVSQLSKETDGRMWLENECLGNWMTALIHILASRYGEEQKIGQRVPSQEAIRIGSMLYLANIWRKYGCGQVRTFYLADKLLKIHTEYDIDWKGHWQVFAWSLVMGVIETGGHMRTEFLDKLRELANSRGMTVQEVLSQAKQVLWLNEALPTIDAVLITETMDWTMKRCLKEMEDPKCLKKLPVLSLTTRRAMKEQIQKVAKH